MSWVERILLIYKSYTLISEKFSCNFFPFLVYIHNLSYPALICYLYNLIFMTQIKFNPRELNPYLKSNGSGYPEGSDQRNSDQNPLLSSAVVGDGGASWRLKALKRAQEQAAREGRKLDDVSCIQIVILVNLNEC